VDTFLEDKPCFRAMKIRSEVSGTCEANRCKGFDRVYHASTYWSKKQRGRVWHKNICNAQKELLFWWAATIGFHMDLDGAFCSFGYDEDPEHAPFSIEYHHSDMRYSGFQRLEEEHFLLANGIVGHNTTLMINTCRVFPNVMTAVVAPGKDLLKQLHADFTEKLPGRQVHGLWSGGPNKIPSDDITVCSMDSLEKLNFRDTRLVLIDEPHAAVTETRGYLLNSFERARRIGFGATLEGRFDGADMLIEAVTGPILAKRTFAEAVAEGAVCNIDVISIDYPIEKRWHFDRNAAYRVNFWNNDKLADCLAWLSNIALPPEWQVLFFISNEKQADFLQAKMGKESHVVAMAKKMTGRAERNELFDRMATGEVRRCIASNIYSTGVTFSNLRAAVNVDGSGAFISCVQKPGRLAEIRPGKKSGILFDFDIRISDKNTYGIAEVTRDRFSDLMVSDSRRRHAIYDKKGYRTHKVPFDPEAILTTLKGLL
jgi:superfamily II DNA or RNA helicase